MPNEVPDKPINKSYKMRNEASIESGIKSLNTTLQAKSAYNMIEIASTKAGTLQDEFLGYKLWVAKHSETKHRR